MAFDRNTSITSAVNRGIPLERIEAGLAKNNMEPLNAFERRLIETGRWGTNYAQRLGMDAKDIATGISTGTALVGQKVTDPNFWLDLAKTNKGFIEAVKGIPQQNLNNANTEVNKKVTNFLGSPYGINTKNDLKTNLENLGVSFAVNPLNALDILPVANAANKIKPIKSATTKAVNKIADVTDNIPVVSDVRKAVLPTTRELEVNKVLNLQEVANAKKISQVQNELKELSKKGDFTQAVENLTTGVWKEGTEDFTKQVQGVIDKYNEEFIKIGLDPIRRENEAITFSILNKLDPDRSKGLLVSDIEEALAKPTKENLELLGTTKDELKTLEVDTFEKYLKGDIDFTTQRGLNKAKEGSGRVDKEGILTKRDIGNATLKEIGENFPKAIEQMQRELNSVESFSNSIDEIVKAGKRVSKEDIPNLKKNEVVVSPTEFADMIKDAYSKGKFGKLPNIINDFSKGASKSSMRRYADDLYVIPKKELDAIKNASSGVTSNIPLINSLKPISGMMKTSVLSTPQYFFGNRLGNVILNTMGGGDYATAINKSLRDELRYDVPDYLKRTTSYSGLSPSSFTEGYKDTLLKQYAEVGRKLKDEGILSGLEEFNRISTSPLFKLESTSEVFDRMAAYYGAAKDMAKELKNSNPKQYRNVSYNQLRDNIIRKAKDTPELERELLNKVNNILGDYVGRNRFINPEVQSTINTVIPFNKIITTSAQILPRLAAEKPLQYQSMFRYPAYYGNQFYKSQEGIPENREARGGVIESPAPYSNGPVRVRYNEYNPLIAPLEYLSMLAPSKEGLIDKLANTGFTGLGYITGLGNALQGEDVFGSPVVGPNTFKGSNGKLITLDNNGNAFNPRTAKVQDEGDKVRAMLGYTSRTFVPLVNLANRLILPSAALFVKQPYYQPTSGSVFGQIGKMQVPYLMEGKHNKGSKGFRDYFLDTTGFRTREVYPEYNPQVTKQDMKKVILNIAKQKRLKELRERGK